MRAVSALVVRYLHGGILRSLGGCHFLWHLTVIFECSDCPRITSSSALEPFALIGWGAAFVVSYRAFDVSRFAVSCVFTSLGRSKGGAFLFLIGTTFSCDND